MHLYERMAQVIREGEPAAVATVIRAQGSVPRHEGSKMLIFPDGQIEGTIGGGEMESRVIEAAQSVIQEGHSQILKYDFQDPARGDPGVCGGEIEVFVEPIVPKTSILVIGAGHVGLAVADLAHWLGYRVIVSDDRPGYATSEAVPDADQVIECEVGALPAHVSINAHTYIVLTTRGLQVDLAGLPALLETSAPYVGVIGSRRRWETCAKQLLEMGVAEEAVQRVTSPMGLELNAETPEEIAVSIMAEITMLRRGGTGEPMAHDVVARRKGKGE
jgi:xanthine dehydrogenase accessory factor